MVDRASDRPAYRQIADQLREGIVTRAYPPGSRLPSEHELAATYGVDRNTARRAMDVLRAEGHVVSRRGAGTLVRERPRLRRMTTELTSRGRAPARAPWLASLDGVGLRPAVTTTIRRAPAPAHMAEWLGVDQSTEVVIRERVMGVEGQSPIQHATSYIPAEVAAAAPQLEALNTGPGGMLSRLEDAGYGPLHFDEIVSARSPLPAELRILQLDAGVPVLVVHRITYSADNQVLDAMERIIASDRCDLAYRFPGEESNQND